MPELNLAACPICHTADSLLHRTRALQGQAYTWYECQACGSVLLSLGADRWAYQKIGRQEQAHLLKKPLTAAELQGLLPRAYPPATIAPLVTAAPESPARRQAQVPEPTAARPSDRAPAPEATPGDRSESEPRLVSRVETPTPLPTPVPVEKKAPPPARRRGSRLFAVVLAGLGLMLLLMVGFMVVRFVLLPEAPLAVAPPATQALPTMPATFTPLSPTDTPTPRPTATWVPTFTPIAPSPTPTLDPELLIGLDDIEQRVVNLRGLEETRPITPTFLTTEELFDYAQAWVDADYEPGEMEAEVRTLAALGFVPRNFDLRRYLVSFYASQVAGFYDYTAKVLYVVNNLRDNKLPPLTQMSFAHEYAHGLEDQHFDLGAFMAAAGPDHDRQMARQALVEGSASLLVDEYYETLDLSSEDLVDLLIQVLTAGGDSLSSTPGEIESMIMFPYTAGAYFVATLYDDGGWAAVNAAFADPPQSTEQILHPARYLVRDEPVAVSLPSLTDTLDSDWTLVSTDTLGEHQLSLYLAQMVSDETAIAACDGWDGDRYALYARGDDDLLVVSTVWDSPAEQDEFVQVYEQFATAWYDQPALGTQENQVWWDTPQQALILSWSDGGAVIVIAPDLATATAVAARLAETGGQ